MSFEPLLTLITKDNIRSRDVKKSIKFVRAYRKLEDVWKSRELQSIMQEIGRVVDDLRQILHIPYSDN